jgi:hypothetical protein
MASSMAVPQELSSAPAVDWDARTKSLAVTLKILQYAYPIFMLVFFLAAFTTRSILSTNSNANITKTTQLGPGGNPLPATDPTRNFVKPKVSDDVSQTQKRVFEWLSLAAALSFIANAVNVITHAIYARDENWWCGKQVVVRTRAQFAAHCSPS